MRLFETAERIDAHIITTETIYIPIARQQCDRVCTDFQWLLYCSFPATTEELIAEHGDVELDLRDGDGTFGDAPSIGGTGPEPVSIRALEILNGNKQNSPGHRTRG